MTLIAVADARAQFSNVLERVQAGEEITITKGARQKPIVVMIPFDVWEEKKPKRRTLGALEHWGLDIEVPKMSYEELMKASEEMVAAKGLGDK